ncbi:unnamed protein product [Adineta steineri]|uniref:Exosome complex component N-terminal domain-containing protein n=1 Tax=Adineta steineri TaxID=433720 RepID=A0A818NMY2_9BILA|nr:unnamed protein product [Adineta steineri]CAF3609915.1 unnamed protein product [Adineta steineri]
MPHRYSRDEKSSSSSHYDKAKMAIRQAYNKPSNNTNDIKNNYNFNLYENDRQDRINEIADDEDGDLVVERQPQSINPEKTTKIIEANDRRHDAVIFGDKTIEEQQKNQSWDSFKQSSKYSTTSLAGPLLLEDPENKRIRWKNKMHDLWIQRYSMSSFEYYCVPGDRLCPCDRAIAGPGTYEKQNCIYASIAGTIQLTAVDQPSANSDKKPTISVVRQDRSLAVPSVGSLAYCKVTNVTSRFVRCLIFAINNQPLKTPCHGRITRENIESINKDSVVCSTKFRPDDIVLARIISLGDANAYLLSTAEENLGVIAARSVAGEKLVPFSDCQMTCPMTNTAEPRKVAKIQGDLTDEISKLT